jgi:hypothetical protein
MYIQRPFAARHNNHRGSEMLAMQTTPDFSPIPLCSPHQFLRKTMAKKGKNAVCTPQPTPSGSTAADIVQNLGKPKKKKKKKTTQP